MQTFLPYPDFTDSALCLDYQYSHNRLSNQVDEGIIILSKLLDPVQSPLESHPIFAMWRGYESALFEYTYICLCIWKERRQVTTSERMDKLGRLATEMLRTERTSKYPVWLSDERLHSSHRSILLAKNPAWYSRFDWKETPAVKNAKGKWPYFWPVVFWPKPNVEGAGFKMLDKHVFEREYLGVFENITPAICACNRGYIIDKLGICVFCNDEKQDTQDHNEALRGPALF